MKSHSKNSFCKQLADWLYASEWHFTTLLNVTIQSVDDLPDDVDKLINALLSRFSSKPSIAELLSFLETSIHIETWFRFSTRKPAIKSLNLDLVEPNGPQPHKGLPKIESIVDLAEWLNITLGELEWLADLKRHDVKSSNTLRHYHYSVVEKRRGGFRLIESPKSLLKEVQRKINSDMLSVLPIHNAAHGFRVKRNTITHAKNHTSKQALILFDIANCFHSIQWRLVYSSVSRLAYSREVSKYLAGLCTHRLSSRDGVVEKLSKHQQELVLQRHLPQGAPTSPTLSNVALYRLDNRLAGLSKSLDMDYSRYADDLAFSSNTLRDWRFLEPLVGSICLEEGFGLNHRKFRIVKAHQRQKLTGVVVNKFPNVDRRYYDGLKAVLTNCVRFGMESQNRDGHEFFYEHLVGCVNHVSSLNSNRGAKLHKILNQIIV